MEIIKGTKALKLLSKVVAKADLISIFMLDGKFWRSMNALDYERVSMEINVSGNLLEEREDCIFTKASFSLSGVPVDDGESEEKEEVTSVKAEYILIYSLAEKDKLSKEELAAFCDVNPAYNAWPYWREFVSNASDRMGLPVPILPLLKFRGRQKGKEKEDNPQ